MLRPRTGLALQVPQQRWSHLARSGRLDCEGRASGVVAQLVAVGVSASQSECQSESARALQPL